MKIMDYKPKIKQEIQNTMQSYYGSMELILISYIISREAYQPLKSKLSRREDQIPKTKTEMEKRMNWFLKLELHSTSGIEIFTQVPPWCRLVAVQSSAPMVLLIARNSQSKF